MMEREIVTERATLATNVGGDKDEHLWPYLQEMFLMLE